MNEPGTDTLPPEQAIPQLLSAIGPLLQRQDYSSMPILEKGDRGEMVKDLQRLLLANDEASVTATAGMTPSAIEMGDLDNDDDEDLVVVGDGSNIVDVFLGNGDGTFGASLGVTIGFSTLVPVIALGDLNGDDDLDLIAAEIAPSPSGGITQLAVLLGDGDGTFTRLTTVAAEDNPNRGSRTA